MKKAEFPRVLKFVNGSMLLETAINLYYLPHGDYHNGKKITEIRKNGFFATARPQIYYSALVLQTHGLVIDG